MRGLQLSIIKKMNEKTNKVWSMDKTLVVTEESAGAVIQGCYVNKICKSAENSHENTCDAFESVRY